MREELATREGPGMAPLKRRRHAGYLSVLVEPLNNDFELSLLQLQRVIGCRDKGRPTSFAWIGLVRVYPPLPPPPSSVCSFVRRSRGGVNVCHDVAGTLSSHAETPILRRTSKGALFLRRICVKDHLIN
jgi:hypothetical protein